MSIRNIFRSKPKSSGPPSNVESEAMSPMELGGLDRQRYDMSAALLEIIVRAMEKAQEARSRADIWSRLYFTVGLPAAILAAVAGATALASSAGRVAAGIIALISAGLGATATFLDSATRQTSYENLAAGWQALANDAQVNRRVDVENDGWLTDESRIELQHLLDRERKLLQGKAPDAEAEAERRSQSEALRAQYQALRAKAETERAEAEAARARAAEQEARASALAAAEATIKGRTLAAAIQVDAEALEAEARSQKPVT